MTSLADKLKALGVKVGANDLGKTPKKKTPSSPFLDSVLGGSAVSTAFGETYAVRAGYPTGAPHGIAALELSSDRSWLARWAGHPAFAELTPEEIVFLDTETTGLAGGTGTYAFLVGIGRFNAGGFELAQFFLRDPSEEQAFLAAIEACIAPCRALVTFNGKAFDSPLLAARYTTHGWKSPHTGLMHVDLLHLARRLWRDRLPSRTLGNLEAQILGARRTEDDVPGWLVPQLYFEFLQTGDPEVLRGVFYHNAMDVLSLVALLDHMSAMLSRPFEVGSTFGADLIALARLFEDLGEITTAAHLYLRGLEHEDAQSEALPRQVFLVAIDRLALIHKRRAEWQAAVSLWQQAARYRHIQAHIELAKCYEHHLRDFHAAAEWTLAALDIIHDSRPGASDDPYPGTYERNQWIPDLQHRLERLQRKINGSPPTDPEIDDEC